MSLDRLYQQTIKDHNRAPYGLDVTFEFTHRSDGYNPSCGDELDTVAGCLHRY